jgi:predicted DNA-binding antitoxin AbrB/MazE fold protein
MPNSIEREQNIHLKQGEKYRIRIDEHFIRFNATTLILTSTLLEKSGQISLSDGDEVLFVGTPDQLKLVGDLASDTLIFKPSQKVKERHYLAERHFLMLHPTLGLDKGDG